MASKEELSEQLAITTKLNTMVQQMAVSVSRIERSYESQTAQVEKLAQVIEELNTGKVVQEVAKLTTSIEKLVTTMTGLGSTSESSMQTMVAEAGKANQASTALSGKLKDVAISTAGIGKAAPAASTINDVLQQGIDASKSFIGNSDKLSKFFGSKLPKQALIGAAAVSGFVQGIKNVLATTKSLAGFFATFVGGAVSITAAIIAIPFKIFTGLVDMAAAASHGGTELAQAFEDLRKEFGDLKGPTSKTIIDLSNNMKGFSDTGLSTYRVFGMLHERLNYLREMMTEVGAAFELVGEEFVNNGGALLGYIKGLGISNDQMANIIVRAKSMGVETSEVFNAMTKQTLSLGKAFGISQKVIGKDMAKALANVAHFGSSTVEQIGQASVYARKLGIELEKITGTLDAFETFDSAADNVATLSQAFGVQLDTFSLVEAENPADQIDHLRKAFSKAGHDAGKFNRQQLKLVSQMTGLDEATAKAAFSLNNQGASLDDIKKKSQEAEKKQLSQADAMSKLADSIERLVKSGGGQTGGFWDQFIKGVMGGLQYSKDFRQIIINIKQGLYAVFNIGLRLGRMLPTLIPDLGTTLGGLAEFFNPRKFSTLFKGISTAMQMAFGKGGNAATGLAHFRKSMEDFFTLQGPSAKKILEGFKGLMRLLSSAVSTAIPYIVEQVSKGLHFIADLIRNPGKLRGAANAGAGGLGFLGQILIPIFDAVKASWPMLSTAMGDLWDAAWPRIKQGLIIVGKKVGPFLAAVFFGPVVMKTLLAAGVNALLGSLKSIVTGAFTPTAGAKSGATAAKGISKAFSSGFAKVFGAVAIGAIIADIAVNINTSMNKFESELTPRFGKTEAKIGGAATGVINALTLGLLPEDIQQNIAETIAEIAQSLFKAVENYFGSGFSNSMKEMMGSSLDVFSQLGQLIKDIFEGDEGKIADSFVALGDKLLTFFGKAIDFLIESLPILAIKFQAFATNLVGSMFIILGKTLQKAKDVPIFGPLFQAIGWAVEKLGEGLKWISKQFTKFSEMFKSNGGIIETIKKSFSSAWDYIKSTWGKGIDAIISLTKTITDPIIQPFKDAWKFVSELFTKGPTEVFGAMYTNVMNKVIGLKIGIEDSFATGWKAVKTIFAGVGTWFTTNVLNPIKNIFVGDGDTGGISGMIKKVFNDSFDSIKEAFSVKKVTDLFGNVVTAIATKLDELLKIPVFKEMIEIAKKVFEIKSPSRVFATMGGDITAGMSEGLKNMPTVVGEHMKKAQQVASREGQGLGKTITQAAQGNQGDAGSSQASTATKNLENINSQLMALKSKAESLGSSAKMFSDEVRTGALIPALQAAQKMIETANSLNTALGEGNLNKLNVQAKLKSVAGAVGLGGSANYTIKNKGVNIHIDMKVVMNADDLEQALIMRANSIIRNRVNFATENPDEKGQNNIPATRTPNLQKLQSTGN